jgi:ABC-type branched-subunit amino acid transport system substrate-binding protein
MQTVSRACALLLVAMLAGLPLVPAARAAPSGPPVRVGSSLALTGPLAATGLVHKIVGEIYVESLNRKSGLLGRPVEWVLLDDQSKPDVARTLYEKLVTVDKVDLIIGPYATGNILAAMGVAQRYGKMLIQHTFGLPHLAKYEMQFPSSPIGPEPNKSAPIPIFDLLEKSKTPPKTIAVVASKFPSTHFIAQGARAEAEKRKVKEVVYLEYEFGTRDWGAIAARVKDANADFLYCSGLGVESVQLLDALKKIDYAPPRHYHLFTAPGPLMNAAEGNHALAYTYFEEHEPFTSRPGAKEMLPLYRDKAKAMGIPYPYFDFQAAASGTAWQLLEASIVATKSLDDKKMAAWLKGAQVDTLMGKLRFDGPNNHGPDLSIVKQVIDKRWVVVWPENVAGAKAVLP